MSDMTDLVKRLRKASEGSRELDAAIYNACPEEGREAVRLPIEEWGDRFDDGWRTKWCDREDKYPEPLKHYTTSLDAALTLVPEGWQWDAGTFAPDEVFNPGGAQAAVHDHRKPDRYAHADAATPAFALCIAALLARKEEG